ncbi:MAG: ABC transporter substrate-binding protein [Alphaproteobacteria bacterium]|nr:ABC transporter substrate-binding protein [Alphaproteobacteria bacterium]
MITRRRFHAGVAGASVAASTIGAPAIAQKKGGDAIVAQVSPPPSLDAPTTSAQHARNITTHIWETLYARDENGNVVPDLAEGVNISPDGLTYTFKLRKAKFHNGKDMTSVDVKASMERYKKVGNSSAVLRDVAAFEAPSADTFAMKLTRPVPSLLDGISSPRAIFAIMPAEEGGKEANKVEYIGTGPFSFVEYRPDSHVRLRRFDGYVPNTAYQGRDGFAGKKTAHLDTVTVRFISEAGARVAALEAGEIHVNELIPTPAAARLKNNRNIKIHEMMPWAFQVIIMNHSQGMMQNLKFRQAIQAVLDYEEIIAIANDGLYRMTHGWQHPGSTYFAGDIGKELYNQKNVAKAKQLLAESGYKGEEIIFLGDSTIANHKGVTEVGTEQLRKQLGINVRPHIVDWPTASSLRLKPEGWHLWALGMGIEPYEGPFNVAGFFVKPQLQPHVEDPVLEEAYLRLQTSPTLDARKKAMADIQRRMYDNVTAIKLGDFGLIQGARANVENFKPYRAPRMWDVWLS